jgi:Lon protease-like protein
MTEAAKPAPASATPLLRALPLFPLQLVLFPDALLGLRVFEPRYLDMVAERLRSGDPFGVVCLRQGGEVEGAPADKAGVQRKPVQMETVGTLARIDEVDAEQPGILHLRCTGMQRFKLAGTPTQRDNGLWVADVQTLPADPLRAPGPAMQHTVRALAEAIRKLEQQDRVPFLPPWRLDDAGWVANRWCELLPVPLAAKQKLMSLDDPVIRLSLVDGFLRDKQIVVG